MLNRVLEITFILVILFLVLSRPGAFSGVVNSLAGAYLGAVKTLQGR